MMRDNSSETPQVVAVNRVFKDLLVKLRADSLRELGNNKHLQSFLSNSTRTLEKQGLMEKGDMLRVWHTLNLPTFAKP